jgi:hypothetical protein
MGTTHAQREWKAFWARRYSLDAVSRLPSPRWPEQKRRVSSQPRPRPREVGLARPTWVYDALMLHRKEPQPPAPYGSEGNKAPAVP